MRKNFSFLVLVGLILIAGGGVLYYGYVNELLTTAAIQQTGVQNQPATLTMEKSPAGLKTDPKTGDKIFEGFGVRFRIPAGFVADFNTITPGKIENMVIQTKSDAGMTRKILQNPIVGEKGFLPPMTYISFELNGEGLSLSEQTKREGLKEGHYQMIEIGGVAAVRFIGTSVGGSTREVYVIPSNKRYIITIGTYEHFDGPEDIVPYHKVFDKILSSFEFIR